MRKILFRLPFLFVAVVCADASQWYRGALHCHSYWSDGDVPPEEAITWYRDHGYQFMSLTDHDILQYDTNRWKKVSEPIYQAYRRKEGEAAVRREGEKFLIHLKTLDQLKTAFQKPDAFLLIPGHESNRSYAGIQAHMNMIDTDELLSIPPTVSDPLAAFRETEKKCRDYRERTGRKTLFILNHPDWPYFDIQPETLIQLPQIRFFELCNADAGARQPRHPQWYTRETFWDAVNAFRIAAGHAPVFGVGSDDTHGYRNPEGRATPGHAWVVVRADRLEPEALMTALQKGDFYASTGVELKDVSFSNRTLHVAIQPEAGIQYEIRFVTTRTSFNRTVERFDDPANGKKPARTGSQYSADIGRLAKTVHGLEGAYTLAPDDLYVRAIIVSSKRPQNRLSNQPEFDTAWTQPYLPLQR